jgi:hypothetical protein
MSRPGRSAKAVLARLAVRGGGGGGGGGGYKHSTMNGGSWT